jgi:hypothetical protein
MFENEFPRLRLIDTCLQEQRYEALQDLTEQEAPHGLISLPALNAARCMRAPATVIYLATLCVANLTNAEEAERWLAVYQSIGQESPTPEFDKRVAGKPLGLVAQVVMRRAAVESLRFDKLSLKHPKAWHEAVECAMDFQQYDVLLVMLQSLAKRKLDTVAWLNLARVMFSRQDSLRRCESIDLLGHSYLLVRERLPVKVVSLTKVRSSLALYASRAFALAGDHDRVLATAPLADTQDDRYFGHYEVARALCRQQRLPESIRQLDELVVEMSRYHRDHGLPVAESLPPELKGPVFDVNLASQALVELQDLLGGVGQKAFLVSGTLLGYAREGQLLAHDKDIDVGIVGWEDQFDVASALIQSGRFQVNLARLNGARSYHIPVFHKATRVHIDIFIYHPENGKWVTGVESDFGYLQKFAFTPFGLKSVKFLGIDFYVPDDVEKKLVENFGNWREPDPCYISHLESPSTVDVGGLEYQVVARLRALEAMAGGNINKLTRVVSLMERLADKPHSMKGQPLMALKAYLNTHEQAEVARAA